MAKKTKAPAAKKEVNIPAPGTTPAAAFNWLIPAFLVLIAAATWWSYSGAFDNKFVSWDDQVYVSENPLLLKPTPQNGAKLWDVVISNNYHPITMWSLFQNVKSGGMNAGPIIKTNVFLHILNSFLVLFFCAALTRGRWWVAGLAGLLFALHPMHVESVAWVSERKDVLYVFFGLLSCLTYLQYLRKGTNLGWLALTLGLFALSCLSKAMAVVFPLIYLLLDYWEGRGWSSLRVWLEKTPFFALSLLFGLIAMDIQKGGNFHGWFGSMEIRNAIASQSIFEPFDRLKFAGYGFSQYLFRLVAPNSLCTYYPYPSQVTKNDFQYLFGALFFVGYLGVMVWAYLRNWRLLFFSMAWGLVTSLLVLQFLSVGTVIMADRYSYLPHVGWMFGLLVFLYDRAGTKWQHTLSGILVFFCGVMAFMTTKQVETWQDSISLWSRVVALYPNDAAAYSKRGNAWGKEHGDLAKAQEDFEIAMKIDPKDSYAFEGMGIISGMQGNHARALEMFTRCIEIQPNYHNFYYNRGLAYLQNKRMAEAITDFEKALALNAAKRDEYLPAYLDALLQVGQGDKARALATEAIAGGLRSAPVYLVRAQVAYQAGDLAAAKADLAEALRIEPNNAFAKQLGERLRIGN